MRLTLPNRRDVSESRSGGAPPASRRRAGTSAIERKEGRVGYALIAPTTVLLTIFYLYPLVQTVAFSFTNWNPATGAAGGFVGLSNFAHLLSDTQFLRAAGNTALYVIVVVPFTMGLGLFFAAMLAKPFRGRVVYRSLLFVPYIAPIVGSALIFSFLLSPLGGVVNGVITSLGFPPVGFLTTEPWALISVIVFSIWQGTGYTMIIYTAALSNIPASYHEAAMLDGAGAIRRFFTISVPLVAPTTGFLAVTGVIASLQVFTQVYVLTGGGPLHSSETLLYYIYQQGFVLFNGGSASAAAVLLLLIGITASIAQLRVLARRDNIELN